MAGNFTTVLLMAIVAVDVCHPSDLLRNHGEQPGHVPGFQRRLTGQTSVDGRQSSPVCRGLIILCLSASHSVGGVTAGDQTF